MSSRSQARISGPLLATAGILAFLSLASALPAQGTQAQNKQAQDKQTAAPTVSLASLPEAPVPQVPSTSSSETPDAGTPEAETPNAIHQAAATTAPQQQQQSRQTLPKPDGQTPQAPAPPSLGDLGLSPSQTKPDPDMQARLDRHTRMLRIHQRLGLITLAPLAGACISSAFAPPDPRKGNGNTVGRDIHVALGATSVTLYAFTASYAIRAPKISDEPARGGIKWHKYLIYVHAPGMVLTPILGAMAFDQANNNEKVHGIASAHTAVAWTTVAAYGAAIVAVSWPIHFGSLKL
jgi:hypothetical protein